MLEDDQLRSAVQTLAAPVDAQAAWTEIERRILRDERTRRMRRLALGAAASAAITTWAVAASRDDRLDTVTVAPSITPSATTPVMGSRWERVESDVARVPFAGDPVVVNTYDGALIWGRTVHVHIGSTGEVRELPPAPINPRNDAGATWTGSELIVWGGMGENDGAAYDLANDRWRTIATSPLSEGHPIAAEWTGTEVVVWGGLADGGRAGAAYNPDTDSWRRITDAPFALERGNAVLVSPDTIIVMGSARELHVGASAQALRYDVSTDSWTILPEPNLDANSTWMVSTGEELIAWDYGLRSRSYRLGDAAWEVLPDIPLDFRECYPGGGWRPGVGALMTYCDQVALFDVTSREWTEQDMPFSVAVDGSERELFGPVVEIPSGLFVLTSEGPLLFR